MPEKIQKKTSPWSMVLGPLIVFSFFGCLFSGNCMQGTTVDVSADPELNGGYVVDTTYVLQKPAFYEIYGGIVSKEDKDVPSTARIDLPPGTRIRITSITWSKGGLVVVRGVNVRGMILDGQATGKDAHLAGISKGPPDVPRTPNKPRVICLDAEMLQPASTSTTPTSPLLPSSSTAESATTPALP